MESNKSTVKVDEIGLFELLLNIILLVRKNMVVITASVVVGIALGSIFYTITPKQYESKMLITSDILTESYSRSLIGNLSKLIKENNYELLSKELSLTADQVAALSGLEIESALEKAINVPESSKLFLNVTVKSKDNSIWPELAKGIVGYFESKEFVKLRVEGRKKYTNQMIAKIDLEIKDLEILKEKIANDGFVKSSKENLILFDPTSINSKILDLTKERINLNNSLELINSIQVVDGFTAFKKAVSPKLSISLVGGTIFGLIISVIIIVLRDVRNAIKKA